MHIFLLKSGGEGQSLLPLVATTLCSILLISIRLSSFDLLHFGTNFRGYIRTCFPITGNPNNLFLFFNFYARIDQIIKEVFTTCDYIETVTNCKLHEFLGSCVEVDYALVSHVGAKSN